MLMRLHKTTRTEIHLISVGIIIIIIITGHGVRKWI